MKHRLFLFAILSLWLTSMAGQATKDSVRIHFRQSKINLDTLYMGNRDALRSFGEKLSIYSHPDSGYMLKSVDVVGGASPEGSVKFNEWLSNKRANKIFDYVTDKYQIPDSLTTFIFLGRDWQGLRNLVADDPNVPYRMETLTLLDEIISNYKEGEKEKAGNLAKVKKLRGGKPYAYMYTHLFPILRTSRLRLRFERPVPPPFIPMPLDDQPYFAAAAPTPVIFHDLAPRVLEYVCKPFYMGIKTNMLYDALTIPNIGIEFYLGKNFSIVGNWMYGWWKTDRRHRYWRAYGGDIAGRYWFGSEAKRKPLTGHHAGIYAGLLTYDFEWGGRGYMGGRPGHNLWDKCNWHAGIEYGYSLPIASRWNIDFTIGLGYLRGEYRIYEPEDNCYVWKETHMRNWIGPTKAEISLVWLIGCDNYNRKYKKGGSK